MAFISSSIQSEIRGGRGFSIYFSSPKTSYSLLLAGSFLSLSLSVIQKVNKLTSICQFQKGVGVLHIDVLPAFLPPAQHFKQNILPAALDFHRFNTMSFFKRGPSEAFRLNAEQTLVAGSPAAFSDSDHAQLQFVQTWASVCVSICVGVVCCAGVVQVKHCRITWMCFFFNCNLCTLQSADVLWLLAYTKLTNGQYQQLQLMCRS